MVLWDYNYNNDGHVHSHAYGITFDLAVWLTNTVYHMRKVLSVGVPPSLPLGIIIICFI